MLSVRNAAGCSWCCSGGHAVCRVGYLRLAANAVAANAVAACWPFALDAALKVRSSYWLLSVKRIAMCDWCDAGSQCR